MQDSTLFRLSGIALIGAGIATALFWLSALPIGTFAGADAVRHVLWVPGQFLHVGGALLTVFGLIGLYLAQRRRAGGLGLAGFVLAVTGAALFLADGLIALAVFPSVAGAAPQLLAVDGAMNRGPVLAAFVTIAAINMIGCILLGTATLRAGVFPRGATILWLIGGVLFNLPPGPVPMALLAAGGVLWGVGSVRLGAVLHSLGAPERA